METMQEMVDRVLEKIPKTKCKCGVIGSFKQIGECYNQYDDNNNPIMMDLDKPCQPHCTCRHSLSSSGCLNCCTHGSKEQQKKQAKILNRIRLDSLKP
jgi:hypothetical protein